MYGPEDEEFYIAGCDIGGEEDRTKPGEEMKVNKRDSTVITIARVGLNELMLPSVEVIHQYWWTGMEFLEQYGMIVELCSVWGIRKMVIDRTGLGSMISSMLQNKLGEDRVVPFNFTRPSKSELTFQFLGLVNSGRLKIYAPDEAPPEIYEECWKQLRLARYSIPGEGLLNMMVSPSDGHDDFLISIALCTEAIREFETPVTEAEIIRPRRLYNDGRY
jgi:hypothetical protein